MIRFAEFKRNLWLEFSLQRLIVLPLILAGILFLSHQGYKELPTDEYISSMQSRISTVFMLLVLLWGARQVSRGINEELAQRTWDFQRMSSLTAMDMLVGKCFGSPAYAWYGGLMLIGSYVGYDIYGTTEPLFIFTTALHFLLITTLVHAATLMFAVLMLRNAAYRHKPRGSTFYTALVLVLVLPAYGLGLAFNAINLMPNGEMLESAFDTVSWFKFDFYSHGFVIASIATFTLWALLGAYRMLASELQYRQWALAWPIFIVFLCAYLAGFVWEQTPDTSLSPLALSSEALIALSIISSALYLSVFFDRIDIGTYRTLQHAWRTRNLSQLLSVLPWWLTCVVLSVIATITALVQATLNDAELATTLWFIGAAYGFMLRDIAIMHLLAFGGVRRLRSAFFVYLAVLYGLIPAIFVETDHMRAVAAMLPTLDFETVSMASAWGQMLVVVGLCLWRWQRSKRLLTQ